MRIEQITRTIQTFPGMPGPALRLLALVDEPNVTVPQIEGILRQDPGLTANMLKLANSAYFGLPSKIGSVRQAVVLLGLKRLVQMVVAACTSAVLESAVPGYDLPGGELWRHSLAVSVAAEGLVRELNLKGREEIFTAALLHDVGKLILGRYVQEDAARIDLALAQGVPFETAEAIVLGTDHAQIGAEVLTQWALPASIVNVVRWHHCPEKSEQADVMLDVVHVANLLCRMIGIGVGRDGLHQQPSPVVTQRLGVTSAHLEKVASLTLQWANDLSAALVG